ncbi:unnamed protein product [Lactuca virosa]|uniref:Transmembrane protein n=1 Tax=Lactuca virosa TaxID=75947 RepID=A0AAU9LMX6_9ASTR|nr:unnamed protein product [Lactuca virosa]
MNYNSTSRTFNPVLPLPPTWSGSAAAGYTLCPPLLLLAQSASAASSDFFLGYALFRFFLFVCQIMRCFKGNPFIVKNKGISWHSSLVFRGIEVRRIESFKLVATVVFVCVFFFHKRLLCSFEGATYFATARKL